MKKLLVLCTLPIVAACATGDFASNGGISVSREREQALSLGMECVEVARILGRPATNVHYRAQPGPTWSYTAIAGSGRVVFDVDFDASCRVRAFAERVTLSNG